MRNRIKADKMNEIIDMISHFYYSVLSSGEKEYSKRKEIETLYSILRSLFKKKHISWDTRIKSAAAKNYKIDETIRYLNRNLITLDKLRILLILIVLAASDNNFSISEVTKILEFAKKLNIKHKHLMDIINTLESKKNEAVSISNFRSFSHTQNSIFEDYVLFGKNPDADINFRNQDISDFEIMLFKLDEYIFIGSNQNSSVQINNKKIKSNHLYLIPQQASLKVGNTEFTHNILSKIYKTKEIYDVIEFKKTDYDFRIINNQNNYSIYVNQGTIFLNGKKITQNKKIPLFFDDTINIEGYDPFNLTIVIKERENIGAELIKPKELFLEYKNNYYQLTNQDSSKALVKIENIDDNLFIIPYSKNSDIFLNNKRIKDKTSFNLNSDIITINRANFRINRFFELIYIPLEIDKMTVQGLLHHFKDGNIALDDFSFEAKKGEILAIMGQSGCGKSTLLKAITGEIIPSYGSVFISDKNLYNYLNFFSKYIGYVPQYDILFQNLTVYENLLYRGRLQMPNLSRSLLDQKINNILMQMKLTHRKNSLVGNQKSSFLSGGERKRLNIAMELLFEPTIVICDEPTSGLSSIDSDQIIDILKNFSEQGKIVILTIHQPNQSIYERFDKILLMDMNGKQVYYGDSDSAFDYFDSELDKITVNYDKILKKKKLKMPEFFLDIIEYPVYKSNGDIVYEQANRSLKVKRRYSPDYWHDKFKKKLLYDVFKFSKQEDKTVKNKQSIKRRKMSFKSHLVQLLTYIKRSFLLKFRNKTNTFITFAEAPLLAFLIAFILRLSPGQTDYSYYSNTNISIYIFISIIIFIFLGLSNSIEEILGEKRSIVREKKLNLKMSYLIISKFLSLSFFSIVQVILFSIVANIILNIRGMFFVNAVYLFLSAMIGFSFGIFISSLINDSKSMINIIPIILIPQIIFGGAVIQFEKMNKDLKISRESPIPELVQVIPSRWLFEGMFTAQAYLNKYDRSLKRLEKNKLTLKRKYKKRVIDEDKYWNEVYEIYEEKGNVSEKFPVEKYTNRLINLTVNLMDGKFLNTGKNVFLSSYKKIFGIQWRSYYFNILVILLYVAILHFITIVRIRYFYKE